MSIEMSNVEMRNEVTVNSLLMKSLESASREYARMCVSRLAEKYGFEKEEALRILNLEKLKLQVQEMKKRSGGKAKERKTEKKMVAKALYPMPFNKRNVSETGCQGLAYNGGLFTQCPKECMKDVRYCKGCQSEIDKNGMPTNGTIEQRLACELMEFRDPKGRKAVPYRKIMEKQKITREQVETEAGKLNILIDEIHFVEEEKKVKEKKVKEKKAVLVTKEDDLIAQLMDEYEESDVSTVIMSEDEEEEQQQEQQQEQITEEKTLMEQKNEAEVALKKQKIAEEKAAKEKKIAEEKAAKEKKIAEEKAAKEKKIAEEKAAKEAELVLKKQKIAEEKAAKEAEMAQKKQQQAEEKAAKEKKIAEEKAAKEHKLAEEKAAKEHKLAEEKAKKEAEKEQKKQQNKPKEAEKVVKNDVVEQKKEAETTETPVPKKVTVKRITIDGKQYLKSSENLLYDPETKEEMGIYDRVTNTIKALPDDSEDELSEDEYDNEA
jgi:hypothetical protein